MLISEREACQVLGATGTSRRHARRALACGLAGLPERTRAAVMYDRDAVEALAARECLGTAELDRLGPHGWFVARREVSTTDSWEEQMVALSGGWQAVSPWVLLTLGFRVEAAGAVPFVATVAGFVVAGADLVRVGGGAGRLSLAEPGAWFAQVRDRRLPLGPGRPWVLSTGPGV